MVSYRVGEFLGFDNRCEEEATIETRPLQRHYRSIPFPGGSLDRPFAPATLEETLGRILGRSGTAAALGGLGLKEAAQADKVRAGVGGRTGTGWMVGWCVLLEAIEKGISPEQSSYLSTSSQRSPAELGFLSVPFVCAESAVRCVLCSEGGCSMCTIARQGVLCGWELRCDAMRCDERAEESRALPTCTPEFRLFRRRRVLENAILPPFPTIMNQPPSSIVASPTPELIFQPPRVGCQSNPIPPTFAFTPATSATQKLAPLPLLAPRRVASRSPSRRDCEGSGRDIFFRRHRPGEGSGYGGPPIMTLLLSVGKRVSSFIFRLVAQGGL